MADYIDREELYEKIKNVYIGSIQLLDNSNTAYAYCLNLINDMPSVDAVEVVRCRDCKHRKGAFCQRFMKKLGEGNVLHCVNDNDYCKWGEKE